jgi:hypothetical protein
VESFLNVEPSPEEREPVLDVPAIDMSHPQAPTTAARETARRRGRPRGSKNQPKPGEAATTAQRRRRSSAGGIDDAAEAMVRAVEALAAAAKEQQRELDELRSRLESLGRILA